MAASTRPGWEYNSDGKLEATFRQNVQPGASGGRSFKNNVVVVANATTGGYDAYYDNRSALGISFGRTALYSFNPDTGKVTPYAANKELFDRVYPGGTSDPQLQALNKSTKNGIIENLKLNATDPIDQKNLKAIREKAGYTSQSNAEAADPNAAGAGTGTGTGTGTEDRTAGPTTGETSEQPPQNIKDLNIEAEERTKYEGTAAAPLRYPEDLAATQQDYLKIRMVKFVPRKIQGGITPSRANAPTDAEQILSTIFLPITGGINDSNTVDWSRGDMDIAAGALAGFTFGAISQGTEGARNAANNTANAIKANVEGVQTAVAGKITEALTGVNSLQRNYGAVLNQNTELLFNGPSLRQHSFTYKFSPRSDTEAEIVRKIIRTLKQGMSAKKANGFLFVKSPHTFFLSYHFKNQDHPFLNKFKQCALTSLTVNYTPDGNYATYYDGSMVSYQVTMSFQELEPVFDSDYGDGYADIGY